MKKSGFRGLAKGQVWKMTHAYIQIVELSKRLIQFKLMKNLSETGVRPVTSEVETLWGYLKSRQARLVGTESVTQV